MIGKIAVSAANFAIDKPYSYRIPEGMRVLPGMRVQLPFGRANKRTEGIVLTVENGDPAGLKAVELCLDEEPILTDRQLRLAAFMRERYFCTFYDVELKRKIVYGFLKLINIRMPLIYLNHSVHDISNQNSLIKSVYFFIITRLDNSEL